MDVLNKPTRFDPCIGRSRRHVAESRFFSAVTGEGGSPARDLTGLPESPFLYPDDRSAPLGWFFVGARPRDGARASRPGGPYILAWRSDEFRGGTPDTFAPFSILSRSAIADPHRPQRVAHSRPRSWARANVRRSSARVYIDVGEVLRIGETTARSAASATSPRRPIDRRSRSSCWPSSLPQMQGELEHRPDDPSLVCPACRLRYAIRDEIPIMLIDEASPL